MRALLCLLICLPLVAQALPEAARNEAGELQVSGRGEMRWLGLKLYEAELWTEEGAFSFERPFALVLTYARDIPGGRLAESSVDEMRRLGERDAVRLKQWRAAMATVFPDVRAGDRIVGLYLPGRGARFFHNDRSTGEVADAQFARAFFAIWLDPRTREPALRERLLGRSR